MTYSGFLRFKNAAKNLSLPPKTKKKKKSQNDPIVIHMHITTQTKILHNQSKITHSLKIKNIN